MKTEVRISFNGNHIPGGPQTVLEPAGCGPDVAVIEQWPPPIPRLDVVITLEDTDERLPKLLELLQQHNRTWWEIRRDRYTDEELDSARLLIAWPDIDCVVFGGPRVGTTYDVSNACLGLLNGMIQAADLIELGRIKAAIVVGTENGRHLVENTVERLNADASLSRDDVKLSIASLTIGAASAAIVLTHRSISRTQNRLLGGTVYADTQHHELCRSGLGVILTSSELPELLTVSDRILVLSEGRMTACFPRSEATEHKIMEAATLGA